MAELKGNKYGTHRVIEPKGVLTQAAWKIDNDMSAASSRILSPVPAVCSRASSLTSARI